MALTKIKLLGSEADISKLSASTQLAYEHAYYDVLLKIEAILKESFTELNLDFDSLICAFEDNLYVDFCCKFGKLTEGINIRFGLSIFSDKRMKLGCIIKCIGKRLYLSKTQKSKLLGQCCADQSMFSIVLLYSTIDNDYNAHSLLADIKTIIDSKYKVLTKHYKNLLQQQEFIETEKLLFLIESL